VVVVHVNLDVLVAGAQKAGSSHIARCIGEHPEIHMVDHEVPYFEDPYFSNTSPQALDAALASTAKRTGIKRPEYLIDDEVPARVARHSPSAVVVVSLRDPIERLRSAYYWYVQFGLVEPRGLNRTVRSALDGQTNEPAVEDLLRSGCYGSALRRWGEFFPPEQMIVVTDHQAQCADTYRAIFSRIGVADSFVPKSLTTRTNRGVYDRRRLHFLRLRRRFLFDWRDTDIYRPTSPRIQAGWRFPIAASMRVVDNVLLSRVFNAPAERFDPDLLSRLHHYYAPEMVMVSHDFGITVPVQVKETAHE
jgi:hypothetical protein